MKTELSKYIGAKIKLYRLENKLTQSELAKILNTTKATISNYETGYRTPQQNMLFDLANALNVQIDDFFPKKTISESIISKTNIVMTELEPPRQQKVYSFAEHELKEQKSYRDKRGSDLDSYRKRKQEVQNWEDIDYYGSAAAGTGEFLIDEHKETITLPSSIIPPGADFCLIVNGNSMEPIILDGSYVFINKTHEIPSGTISAVMVNSEAFIKRVWFENGHARLESFNDKYDDIIVTKEDDFHIIGKVVM